MTLPEDFVAYMRTLLGEEYREFAAALEQPSPTSIRVNPRKRTFAGNSLVPWCKNGLYLSQRPVFTFDPLFHAGCYYVQEASSMILGEVTRQHVTAPSLALDLCAAPGGKSTQLLEALPAGSLLVANEVIKSRAAILRENIVKHGNPNVIVTNNDPTDFRKQNNLFDVILVDAPCSGEGMFRKDPKAVEEWSKRNVDICQQRQRRIVADIWPCLKPGGLLIYSTCTYNLLEDEQNATWICQELGAEPVAVPTPTAWHIGGSMDGSGLLALRFLPHKTKGEGFFMAVLRKNNSDDEVPTRQASFKKGKKGKSAAQSLKIPNELRGWVIPSALDDYDFFRIGDTITLFPKRWKNVLDSFHQLRVIYHGTHIAEIKGTKPLPAHALAMSTLIRSDAFPQLAVDYDKAIAYLRRDCLSLSSPTHGFMLVTYENTPLGFVKSLGNRMNNLYPQEWRILSDRRPTEAVTVF